MPGLFKDSIGILQGLDTVDLGLYKDYAGFYFRVIWGYIGIL